MKKKRLITFFAVCAIACCGMFGATSLFRTGNTEARALSYGDVFVENEYLKTFDGTLSPTYHENRSTGLRLQFSQATTIKYKSVLNLSDNDKSVPLFSILFTPEEMYTRDFTEVTMTFTDCFDANNKLTIKLTSPGSQYPKESCVAAYAGTQKEYKKGWVGYDGSPYGATDTPLTCYIDYENLSVYASPEHNTTDKVGLVRDLRLEDGTGVASVGKEEPWTGFTTGYCTFEIEVKTASSIASMLLLNVDGVDFTKQAPENSDDRLELLIDYDGYTADTIPNGVKDVSYPVFDCKCYSLFDGYLSNIVPIAVDYAGNAVPIIDGKFTPTQSGNYFLLYGSETASGATVNKRVKIVVDDASGNEINYSFNDAVAGTAKVNDVILLPDGTASGGSGRLTVVSAILNSDEEPVELLYENDTNIFIPKTAGTYTLETTVTDFLGRSEAFRKTITVNENPDIIDVNYVPLAVKAGAAFNIPSYVCSDESKTVKVYIDGNEYTDSKYTPTKDFELKYVAGSYEEPYNVKAINVASEKGFMKNYFLCDGGEATFNDDSELLLRANADGAKYTFLQKISSRYLEIGLKLNKDKADYSALNFYIQDAERVDVQIKASLVFENDKFYLVYDGAKKASLASDYYSNVGVIKYSYDKNAFVENDGTIVAEPSQILNGRLFNGFGDYVYLTIEYEGVTGDCEMIMSSVANQIISDKKTDTVKPEVYFDSIQAFTTRLGVGDSITLSKVYAYDVLQGETTTSVEIFLLKGDDKESVYRVTDENGYAYTFNQAGTYEIVYSAQDSVGNGVESRKTIYCVDTTPPTITLKKYSKSASLGKNYKLPTYNVSDNDSDVTTYIIVCYDTGYEELMSDGYRFKTAGTHKIRVLAIDAAGNSSAAEYTVEVK